jgi:ATP-dependent Clp endopeptidase proteolytic subunit ClpP
MTDKEDKPPGQELATFATMLAPDLMPDDRLIHLYGTVDEVMGLQACGKLMQIYLDEVVALTQGKEGESESVKILVSTLGGVAVELFAMYDMIRMIKNFTPVQTFGFGKVMSSGLLLLACGTKGERVIGKNTRLMFHDVIAESHGHIHEIRNSMKETMMIQKTFMSALVDETGLTEKSIKKLLLKKRDIYFSAEEAVEFGIADIII